MKTWLRTLFRILRRRASRPGRTIEPKPLSAAAGHSPHWFAAAIRRAIAEEQWDRAASIIDDAGRAFRAVPDIAEQIARFHLAVDRPDRALHALDDAIVQTTALRMLRNICLVVAGCTGAARADLERWIRRDGAPFEAHTLLAHLNAARGDLAAARTLLESIVQSDSNPHALAALVAICMEQGADADAARWADLLRASCTLHDCDPALDRLLDALALPPTERPVPLPDVHINAFAVDLVAHEEIIPVLAAAQEIEPDGDTIGLLIAALEQALPDLQRPATGYASLARLARLAGDLDSARHWIGEGRRAHPRSTELASLAEQFATHPLSEPRRDDADVIARIRPGGDRSDREAA